MGVAPVLSYHYGKQDREQLKNVFSLCMQYNFSPTLSCPGQVSENISCPFAAQRTIPLLLLVSDNRSLHRIFYGRRSSTQLSRWKARSGTAKECIFSLNALCPLCFCYRFCDSLFVWFCTRKITATSIVSNSATGTASHIPITPQKRGSVRKGRLS